MAIERKLHPQNLYKFHSELYCVIGQKYTAPLFMIHLVLLL